ncbi:hypothetical protein [Photorhabdus hindustanensis]|nr:hypothetical protein [Photorhabdus hindustanensis]
MQEISGRKPIIITVSGGPNLGKSHFMRKLGSEIFQLDNKAILIDESYFRHPSISLNLSNLMRIDLLFNCI